MSKAMTIDGCTVAYEERGRGAPVLLIHGLGSNRASWRLQVAALAERYRVITYDVRGHGDSGRPQSGYSVRRLAADTAGLIRALGIDSVHLVGLSLGGMIGFQLAVDHPELVASLVIVNSGPELVPRSLGDHLKLGTRRLLTRLLSPARLAKILSPRLFPAPEQAPLREEFGASMAAMDPVIYRRLLRALIGWSVTDRLAVVRCPVLVVSGDRDYTPVSHKQAYMRHLADARLVVMDDAGHAAPLERPEPFNDHLLEFLSAVAAVDAA